MKRELNLIKTSTFETKGKGGKLTCKYIKSRHICANAILYFIGFLFLLIKFLRSQRSRNRVNLVYKTTLDEFVLYNILFELNSFQKRLNKRVSRDFLLRQCQHIYLRVLSNIQVTRNWSTFRTNSIWFISFCCNIIKVVSISLFSFEFE